MNRLALFLVNIPDPNLLLPVTADLGKVPGVISWQAVDGHASLVATVEGSSDPLLDHLNRTGGHLMVTMCEVVSPNSNGNRLTFSPDLCYAWVFADVEPSRVESVRTHLVTVDGVARIFQTRGGCDLILLVSGATLDQVDRIISHEIQPLDGLLRLKRNRIINLTSL